MKYSIGDFRIKDKDLAARIGELYTAHGTIETPAILPVIDIERQEVSIEDITRQKIKAIITNAYLLWKRVGNIVIEKKIHQFLGFDGVIMTDSGAYQILRYGDIDVDQPTIIEYQKAIDSDIAVILDIPTGSTHEYKQAEKSAQQTLQRARDALPLIDTDKRVWVLPIQGGPFPDLLRVSARESSRLGESYHVYALGSPTVLLEEYLFDKLIEMIIIVKEEIPLTKPLHLFGAGHPLIIPFAIALGVDLFDSASYILYARNDRYISSSRTYRLSEMTYFPCSCEICSRYEPQELLMIDKNERTRLLALHNLKVLQTSINEVKNAIKEGRLWELLERKSREHPSLARAFKLVTKYANKLAKLTPRSKGVRAYGVFLFGPESIFNPKVIQHHENLLNRYKPRKGPDIVLIPLLPGDKPFTRSRIYRKIREAITNIKEKHIVGYTLYYGIIPEELAETYPLSQFEMNDYPYKEVLDTTLSRIIEYLEKNKDHYSGKITTIYCRDVEWSRNIAMMLAKYTSIEDRVILQEHRCTGNERNKE